MKNFAKKSLLRVWIYWAYSSAWLERIPDKDEVASSNPQGSTRIFVGLPATFKVKLEIYRRTNAL